MRRTLFALILAPVAAYAVISVHGTDAQGAACPLVNSIVSLRSPLEDPDVLIWKDRRMLLNYVAGKWGVYMASENTNLLKPETRARVVASCIDGNHAVTGIRVLDGYHARQYGWVETRDVHP